MPSGIAIGDMFFHGLTGEFNVFTNSSVNAYVSVDPPLNSSGSIDLFISAIPSGVSQNLNSLDMYLLGGDISFYNTFYGFVEGTGLGYDASSGNLNLYLNASINSLSNTVDMYLQSTGGDGLYSYKSIDMVITGDGISDGYVPNNDFFYGFLYNQGSESGIDAYSIGHGVGSGMLDLYITGISGTENDSIDMYIKVGEASTDKKLDLFIRGY